MPRVSVHGFLVVYATHNCMLLKPQHLNTTASKSGSTMGPLQISILVIRSAARGGCRVLSLPKSAQVITRLSPGIMCRKSNGGGVNGNGNRIPLNVNPAKPITISITYRGSRDENPIKAVEGRPPFFPPYDLAQNSDCSCEGKHYGHGQPKAKKKLSEKRGR